MDAVAIAFLHIVGQTVDLQLVRLQGAAPAWTGRLAAAHTIPREFADADYVLQPERLRQLTTPTLLMLGGDSPAFLKNGTHALAKALIGEVEEGHEDDPNQDVAVLLVDVGQHEVVAGQQPLGLDAEVPHQRAVHVLGGVVALVFLMFHVKHYGPHRYAKVENVALYWHFVDIVWIFLFPIVYLL